nr:serine/threonine protein kinase [Streptomyces sp. GS7]
MTATIGRGGMGVVARAMDELLNREVAVKVLRAFTDASTSELRDLRTRMQREAQAAARIRHTGVVTVHDVTEEQGLPVIVMELVDGPSLDEVLTERGPLEPHEAAAIGAKLMDALDAAHRVGVLHRDVKPGNVLLEHGGRVVLTDFGIATMETSDDEAAAKLTQSGQLVGSLDYLPPERAQGSAPGPASDIWSLGMTLYAAVEGTAPFRRTSVWSTLSAIITEPLPEPRRSGPLSPVLQALMAKAPENRPTAEQAREMLERAAAGRTMNLTPPTPVPPGAPTPALTSTESAAASPPRTAAPTPFPATAPTPPPGFSAAPRFEPPSSSPQAPHTGYPPSGLPPTLPHPGVPAASHAPGSDPATADSGRRRNRTLTAAAAAFVVVAGGGVTYALTSGASGNEPQAASASNFPASKGQPSGEGTVAGGNSLPSASPSAKPSAPRRASPSSSAKPTSVPTTCSGWNHLDPKPGTYGYLSGDHKILTGPYKDCSSAASAKSGTKLWFHCSVENSYGHKWIYARIAGTKDAGWMSADNIIRQSGKPVHC